MSLDVDAITLPVDTEQDQIEIEMAESNADWPRLAVTIEEHHVEEVALYEQFKESADPNFVHNHQVQYDWRNSELHTNLMLATVPILFFVSMVLTVQKDGWKSEFGPAVEATSSWSIVFSLILLLYIDLPKRGS